MLKHLKSQVQASQLQLHFRLGPEVGLKPH